MWKKRYLTYTDFDETQKKPAAAEHRQKKNRSVDSFSWEIGQSGINHGNLMTNTLPSGQSYRASLRAGYLVEDRQGHLIVTHISHQDDRPLDLSLSPEPHNTPKPVLPPLDVRKMFPHLKHTSTGALVLWNFLWALLQENKHSDVARWVQGNKFKIVNPDLLAEYWGQLKETTSMEWTKIKKVIQLASS